MGFLHSFSRLTLATACAVAACASPATQRHEAAIVGGKAATPGEFPELALIYNGTTGRVCSGTLIAPDAVVTAAHCADGTTEPARELKVYFDTIDMRFPGRVAQLARVVRHPNYLEGGATPQFDIAILELSDALTDRRSAPIALESAAVGDVYLQVGFGRTDPADQGSYGNLHHYREPSTSCVPYQLAEAQYLCFREDDGDGVCDGDSGGPMFREEAGARTMVGMVAFGRGASCRELGVGLQLAPLYAFLKQHLGTRLACSQDGVCDNSCDDQGIIDLDCQVCETATDCKLGDYCLGGDCVPPKNAELADAARGGTALATGCDAGAGGQGAASLWLIMAAMLVGLGRRARGTPYLRCQTKTFR